MSKIYTKTGDDGTTGLLSGKRVKKSDLKIESYGQVDHLNSHMGLLIQGLEENFKYKKTLIEIQITLFDLGALLACPVEKRDTFKLKSIDKSAIEKLEKEIDEMSEVLPNMTHFILPGGSLNASYAHVCRTQARNIERILVSLDDLPENAGEYINRLSDYLFSLSRFINFELGVKEQIWEP